MNINKRIQNRTIKTYSTKQRDLSRKSYAEYADGIKCVCKCPKCGNLHDKYLFWSGRGMPRIYCTECFVFLENINYLSDEEEHNLNLRTRRVRQVFGR